MKPGTSRSEKDASARAGFSLLAELRNWSRELEEWQQLALLRILRNGKLSEDDHTDVYELFLYEHDLAGQPAKYTTFDLSFSDIPDLAEQETAVTLDEIIHVQGVNALAPDSCITVGPQLTVIYGAMGSGKSGFARILKNAGFTRSEDREVLGNVYQEEEEMPEPTARLSMTVDGVKQCFLWKPEKQVAILRDRFAVFDSSCTRVTIDQENVFMTPYGFDVFPKLVQVTDRLRERLDAQIEAAKPETEHFLLPDEESEVSRLLEDLSAETPVEHLRELAIFEETEAEQLTLVHEKLQKLQTTDPAEQISELEQMRADLETLRQKFALVQRQLGDPSVEKIRALETDLEGLIKEAQAASAVAFEEEPVQPVGTEAWVHLIRAALEYGEEAYPEEGFPAEQEDSRCVLCQQVLSAEARDRVSRFVEHVQSDIEERRQEKEQELDQAYAQVKELDLTFFGADSALRRSAEARSVKFCGAAQVYIQQARERKAAIKSANTEQDWKKLPSLTCPVSELSRCLSLIDEELSALRGIETAQRIAELTSKKVLLEHRRHLSSIIENVIEAVDALGWISVADIARRSLRTHAITNKHTELAEGLLAQQYKQAFSRELKALDADLDFKIPVRGSKGKSQRTLRLDAPSSPDKATRVLSEGEQRAAAMADFLAEVGIAADIAGIILDDPVSSMDHRRQEAVAKRLVGEAKSRQVVLFTHDVVFTYHLWKTAQKRDVKMEMHTLLRQDGLTGQVDVAPFPSPKGEKEALQRSKAALKEAQTLTGCSRQSRLHSACGWLRTAYEEFVQKKLFGNIVRRWEERIGYKLEDVYFDHDVAVDVQERLEFLSRFIDAHSHSLAFQEKPLDIDLVQRELERFEQIKGEYTKRKKEWRNNR